VVNLTNMAPEPLTLGFLPLIVFGVCAVVTVATLMAFGRRRRRNPGGVARACGHCGYDVRGLPTFACPECGSDLRQVGIVSGGGPNPVVLLLSSLYRAIPRLLLATMAIVAVTALAGYVLINFVVSYEVEPASEVTLEPASKGYRLLVGTGGKERHVAGLRNARGNAGPSQVLSLRIAQPGQVVDYNTDLRIDLATWSSTLYHWVGGVSPSTKPVPFDRARLEDAFREKDVKVAAAELDSLMFLIDACRTAPVDRVAPTAKLFTVISSVDQTRSSYAGPFPLGPPLMNGALALWLVAATTIVLTRMWRYRDGVPVRRAAVGPAGVVEAPPTPATAARTVTVLFSDIKDYTARSAAGPRAGALDLVRRHRDLAQPIIRGRRGQVVKTIGDALLATFDSATDAALAGLEIQQTLAAQNDAAASEADRLHLRIAVATGDVIVEAGDVYGPTVNLASRLQAVAAPGQVLLSTTTQSLLNAHELATEPAGPFALAGFSERVVAFVALPVASVPAH
jgi:class 3 adenylate cyclase